MYDGAELTVGNEYGLNSISLFTDKYLYISIHEDDNLLAEYTIENPYGSDVNIWNKTDVIFTPVASGEVVVTLTLVD